MQVVRVLFQRFKLADVGGEIVVKLGKLLVRDRVDLYVENGVLALQVFGVVLHGEGDGDVLLLADVHADELLLKARDEGLGADHELLAFGRAAVELHAVHGAGIIERSLRRRLPRRGLQPATRRAICFCSCFRRASSSSLVTACSVREISTPLYVAELDLGVHVHLAAELHVLAL